PALMARQPEQQRAVRVVIQMGAEHRARTAGGSRQRHGGVGRPSASTTPQRGPGRRSLSPFGASTHVGKLPAAGACRRVCPRAGVPEQWQWGEGVTSVLAGPDGSRCLKIGTAVAQYSMSGQYLPLDGRRVRKIAVSGMVKVKNVARGVEESDRCRLMLLFFD